MKEDLEVYITSKDHYVCGCGKSHDITYIKVSAVSSLVCDTCDTAVNLFRRPETKKVETDLSLFD